MKRKVFLLFIFLSIVFVLSNLKVFAVEEWDEKEKLEKQLEQYLENDSSNDEENNTKEGIIEKMTENEEKVKTGEKFNDDVDKNVGATGYSTSSAIDIKFNTTYSKIWTSSNYTYDCYNKITVSQNGYVSFVMKKPIDSKGEYGNVKLYFYNESGVKVAEVYTEYANKVSDYYTYSFCVTPGTYYLNIDPRFYVTSGSISTAYVFGFTNNSYIEKEPNNSTSTATYLEPGKVYFAFWGDNGFNDTDYFRFDVQAGVETRIYIYNFPALDDTTTMINLFTPDGNSKYITYYFKYDVETEYYYYSFVPKTSGRAYVCVENYFGAQIPYLISALNANSLNSILGGIETPEYMFNARYYADLYPDLKKAFGYDENSLRNHYIKSGVKEGRQATPIYSPQYYLGKYKDLSVAFGTDYEAVYNHFMNYGLNEGRQGNQEFNVSYYLAQYPDLKNAFGTNYRAAATHYVKFGKAEGRVGSIETPINISNYIFDANLYYSLYPDLQRAIGNNVEGLKSHYLNYGINEGRVASFVFDAKYYLNKYGDLRNAFSSKGYKNAYNHFINNGINEGRVASKYFDVKYYLNKNGDLKNVFGTNNSRVLEHFVKYGLNEGRIASSEFSVIAYKNNYKDLQNAFGNNWRQYYNHYINWGQKEKRKCI